jgi:hypothetical protein
MTTTEPRTFVGSNASGQVLTKHTWGAGVRETVLTAVDGRLPTLSISADALPEEVSQALDFLMDAQAEFVFAHFGPSTHGAERALHGAGSIEAIRQVPGDYGTDTVYRVTRRHEGSLVANPEVTPAFGTHGIRWDEDCTVCGKNGQVDNQTSCCVLHHG